MTNCAIFTEEPSARIVLEEIARRVAPEKHFTIIDHNGKNDLKESISRKIGAWQYPPDMKFLIVHDRDSHNDCRALKQEILDLIPSGVRSRTLVRIPMPCLEAWYLSDPEALARAGLIGARKAMSMARSSKFRNPERLNNAKEEFFRLHDQKGQLNLARLIAPHLSMERSVSRSFKVTVEALRDI